MGTRESCSSLPVMASQEQSARRRRSRRCETRRRRPKIGVDEAIVAWVGAGALMAGWLWRESVEEEYLQLDNGARIKIYL